LSASKADVLARKLGVSRGSNGRIIADMNARHSWVRHRLPLCSCAASSTVAPHESPFHRPDLSSDKLNRGNVAPAACCMAAHGVVASEAFAGQP